MEKAKEEAKLWIGSKIRACVFDCSDSSNYAQTHQDRFNALVDDSVSIVDFIKNDEKLLNFYYETLKNPEFDGVDLKSPYLPEKLPIEVK